MRALVSSLRRATVRRAALLVVLGLEASVLVLSLAPREDDYEPFLFEPIVAFVYGSLVLTPIFAPFCLPGAAAVTAALRRLERGGAGTTRRLLTSLALSPLLGAPIFALFALEPGAPGTADWVLLLVPGLVFATGAVWWDTRSSRDR